MIVQWGLGQMTDNHDLHIEVQGATSSSPCQGRSSWSHITSWTIHRNCGRNPIGGRSRYLCHPGSVSRAWIAAKDKAMEVGLLVAHRVQGEPKPKPRNAGDLRAGATRYRRWLASGTLGGIAPIIETRTEC